MLIEQFLSPFLSHNAAERDNQWIINKAYAKTDAKGQNIAIYLYVSMYCENDQEPNMKVCMHKRVIPGLKLDLV